MNREMLMLVDAISRERPLNAIRFGAVESALASANCSFTAPT